MSNTEDGRTYRRLVVELPAEVAGVAMLTANLSLQGAQVVCPQIRYELNAEVLAKRPLPLTLQLGEGESASVTCGVKYVSGYDDEVLLGLQFGTDPSAPTPEAIGKFLERRGGSRYIQPVEG